MTSIGVKFRPSTVDGKEGMVYYQVIHKRKTKQISTDYRISPCEWDSRSQEIHIPSSSAPDRKSYLISTKENIASEQRRLERLILSLKSKGKAYTADDLVSAFHQSSDEGRLSSFMQRIIEQLRNQGKVRTAETYSCSLNRFMGFRKEIDIHLDELDSDLMLSYEAWLKDQGACMNTISFYMRILRAVYNRGVEKGLTPQQHPFKRIYTGVERTVKRAVPFKTIKQIKQADLWSSPSLDYARDIFMLSFYTRGMSFVDMAYLKKTDLNNGILSYRRKKTGQSLFVRWEECMQQIINKYPSIPGSPYLFPIIKEPAGDPRKQYLNAILSINKNLKTLSRILELPTTLTTYVARHSWASIAKSKNIPLSVISEGMGHDSEMTTRIYLASLDTAVIDEANRLILNDL